MRIVRPLGPWVAALGLVFVLGRASIAEAQLAEPALDTGLAPWSPDASKSGPRALATRVDRHGVRFTWSRDGSGRTWVCATLASGASACAPSVPRPHVGRLEIAFGSVLVWGGVFTMGMGGFMNHPLFACGGLFETDTPETYSDCGRSTGDGNGLIALGGVGAAGGLVLVSVGIVNVHRFHRGVRALRRRVLASPVLAHAGGYRTVGARLSLRF